MSTSRVGSLVVSHVHVGSLDVFLENLTTRICPSLRSFKNVNYVDLSNHCGRNFIPTCTCTQYLV